MVIYKFIKLLIKNQLLTLYFIFYFGKYFLKVLYILKKSPLWVLFAVLFVFAMIRLVYFYYGAKIKAKILAKKITVKPMSD